MPHYTGELARNWLIALLLIVYLFDLGGVGFLKEDEPRYASIGRAMAASGDLVTPRLDGQPWFEKPPLLYWMIAAGRWIRLPDEWAARLPVALMSIAFLAYFFQVVMREFNPRVAITATAILGTSAGWIAYSSLAVTDLPMSATLMAAMMIAMFDTRRNQGYLAGALLGLSILAKAFVPIVLFAPMFLVARGKRLTMLAGCILVAAPWLILCTLRNGEAFWQEFFWKQQVGRVLAIYRPHDQPFWYYVPVVLAGLFPWTPLAGLLARPKIYDDVRVRFLVGWSLYTLVFFSVVRNKLPGYILPILPPLAIAMAYSLDKMRSAAKWWLTASSLLLVVLPTIMNALPEALLEGFRKAPLVFAPAFPFLAVAGAVLWLAWREERIAAVLLAAVAVAGGLIYVKWKVFPILDQQVSVRGFWKSNQAEAANACTEGIRRDRRDWEYGLNYYAGRALPECEPGNTPRIIVEDKRLVIRP